MNLKVIEARLRREYELPDDFKFYAWKCYPPGSDTIYVEFKGAICTEVYKSGPRKGRTNYQKSTGEREFHVPVDRAAKWEAEWQAETGNCLNCTGTGNEWAGWSSTEGNKERPCRKCGATGKVQQPEVTEALTPK